MLMLYKAFFMSHLNTVNQPLYLWLKFTPLKTNAAVILTFWIHCQINFAPQATESWFYLDTRGLHNTLSEPHWVKGYLGTSNRSHWIALIYKSFTFFQMCFLYVWGLHTMCSIFPFQNDLLSCSFSIQGLFNRIPVLILQIQGLFMEKVIFKEFF